MKGPCLVWSPRGAPGVRSPRVLLRRRAPGHTVPAVAANMAELPNAKPRTPECKGEEKKGTPSSPRRRPAAQLAALGGNLRESHGAKNEAARSRWRHDSSARSRSMSRGEPGHSRGSHYTLPRSDQEGQTNLETKVLGFFSIQEKALFDTRYHYISLHITLLSLCIILYHCRYHNISCPSATHDINDIDDT